MEESRRFRVGYALALKKLQSFIQPSLVNLAKERGIDLVSIDTARPLTEQGPFDCVLHKLYGDDWKAQLKDYAVMNPFIPIIDPPDYIDRLRNRISMLEVVSQIDISQEKETFGIPQQIVVYDSMSLLDSWDVGALRFPVISKPIVADGSAESHKMTLVYHREGLLLLKPPLVLQEFVNHGGVIFKVYVVGDYVKCVKRKSLPDVSLEMLNYSEGSSLSFSQVSNMAMQNGTHEYYESFHLDETEMPPMSFVTNIAMGLRRAMELHLFNFDVIRDSKAGNRYFTKALGREPTIAEMHARTHQRQDNQQWVDERARRAHEDYERLLQQSTHESTADAGPRSSFSTSAQSEYELWSQTVGGKKKGRMYGLGSSSSAFTAGRASTSSAPTWSSYDEGKFKRMETNMELILSELQSLRERVDRNENKGKAAAEVEEEEEEEEEDEEDDE